MFTDTATTAIYTLSLHDALPISAPIVSSDRVRKFLLGESPLTKNLDQPFEGAYSESMSEKVYEGSEEHTSELQSRGLISYAVFCLKKKKEKKKRKKKKKRKYNAQL